MVGMGIKSRTMTSEATGNHAANVYFFVDEFSISTCFNLYILPFFSETKLIHLIGILVDLQDFNAFLCASTAAMLPSIHWVEKLPKFFGGQFLSPKKTGLQGVLLNVQVVWEVDATDLRTVRRWKRTYYLMVIAHESMESAKTVGVPPSVGRILIIPYPGMQMGKYG